MEQTRDLLPQDPGFVARVFHHILSSLRHGELRLTIDDWSLTIRGDEPGVCAELTIHRPWRVLWALVTRGDVGFGESYTRADLDSPDLRALMQLLVHNETYLQANLQGLPTMPWFGRLLKLLNDNSLTGSRRNIAAHYDLGNDFFGAWLDASMTYSAACFEQPDQDLAAAQVAKYRYLLDLTGAQPGDHIAEIGCGWGSFAAYAASRGMRVTALTLSRAQHAHALRIVRSLGLTGRVDVRLQDYRQLEEQFDHIVSIEMFEAVGERHWRTFMERVGRMLRPGGRAALQVITIEDRCFDRYRRRADFIQRYIFPGGMLPSPTAFTDAAAGAGLRQMATTFDAADYAETLALWRDRFTAGVRQGAHADRDRRFLRLWDYYLCLCEAGFRTGPIDLMRTVLTHE